MVHCNTGVEVAAIDLDQGNLAAARYDPSDDLLRAEPMTLFHILLALHVLGVVWWIGGVAMVTAVLLPMYNRLPDDQRLERIQALERRFANQARVAVVLVGVSGFWLLAMSGGLARLAQAWWINLMIVVWLAFTVMLFVAEPLGLPKRLGLIRSRRGFWWVHLLLLCLALAAIVGGVVGSRGGFA